MTNNTSHSTTRRDFLATATALALVPSLAGGATSAYGEVADDSRSPEFHLLPAKNWMNDPNGIIFFNGKYHMFFQCNPQAAVWGDMSWHHSGSTDILYWTHRTLAFTSTAGGPAAFGCFSGSAIAVGKRVYVVYTGAVESVPDLSTIRDGSDKLREPQCLAFSDDPDLIHWTKVFKTIVPIAPEGMSRTGSRDPSAWRQDDPYYRTVGSCVPGVGGYVLRHRSKDLYTWEYLHPRATGTWNGKKTPNPWDDGEMWECPEFFALDGTHVLIYSTRQADWSGMMSLPRVMHVDPDGTLRLQILPEAAKLRSDTIPIERRGFLSHELVPKESSGPRVDVPSGGCHRLVSQN